MQTVSSCLPDHCAHLSSWQVVLNIKSLAGWQSPLFQRPAAFSHIQLQHYLWLFDHVMCGRQCCKRQRGWASPTWWFSRIGARGWSWFCWVRKGGGRDGAAYAGYGPKGTRIDMGCRLWFHCQYFTDFDSHNVRHWNHYQHLFQLYKNDLTRQTARKCAEVLIVTFVSSELWWATEQELLAI